MYIGVVNKIGHTVDYTCKYSLFYPIQAKNDANDAVILYRTLICDPLGPNMCADVGLEAFEYQSEQYWPYSGLDVYFHCLTLFRPRTTP